MNYLRASISFIQMFACCGLAFQARAAELLLREITPFPITLEAPQFPDQLPHSRVSRAEGALSTAWLAGATDRYRHGVLGDALEASRLMAQPRAGKPLRVDLPANRVFEDLHARIVDMGEGDRDQILLVESDLALGASAAIYGVVAGNLARRAATPFIGQSGRWLNPLGVGDFDGDGKPDVALVITPHIGGILRLYRLENGTLRQFAERTGVSTHRLGSTELGMGRVVSNAGRDWLLLPVDGQRALILLEWSNGQWNELARATLASRMSSSLYPAGLDQWRFKTEDGRFAQIQLIRR
ncbi:MAG: hypothetical protein ACKVQK_11790 [Burkholderiales bacterium]